MKGMIFFIIGIIIVFGVYKFSQNSSSEVSNSEEAAKQEIKQELEKMGVEIDVGDLEKVE